MKVVITGGAGFIGLRLARRILDIGKLHGPSGKLEPIGSVVLFDNVVPSERPADLDARAQFVAGEVFDRDTIFRIIDRPDIAVFHLASIVSGGAEQDFDLAMKVNLDGHLHVLEAMRRLGPKPRYVFSSSIATYGGAQVPKQVADPTRHTPQTTYGMTKSVGELLVNDYTRKGFIDGRSARLSTVIVRPGKPNKAASSFVSAVIREPLNGVDYELPVGWDTTMPVVGYRTVVDGIIALYELDSAKLGDDRAMNLPNISVTVAEMVASLKRVAAGRALGHISVKIDPFVAPIVAGWPAHVDASRAEGLGLPKDAGLDTIISAYMADYL
ncbi:MAG: NAD-dependent epimerase/dehydratase family protein [Rhodospirillaceae bacterium]|nr:NAD-dependent epimerase/dehydratase family protein [Rhodospirillaceae bacterium]